ncbi:MAG: lysyl-tRNA synthetase, class II [Parcubacteria group bacterium Gr01-1014_33]|nr:MAG: lysyl-tRNA synthetase, class II [Parcubacteria group bacterium Gr01-1014_33]
MPFDDIRNERLKKLQTLKEKGIDPYPAHTERGLLVAEVLKKFSALAKSKKSVVAAGRVMTKREHGGSTFFDVEDTSGKIQGYAKEDILKENYLLFLQTVDIGDFVEIEGTLFETKKKEKTIEVSRWAMLSKSLRPLPEKWHGLQDVEERFRKRYLDLLMNEGVQNRFQLRAQLITAVRAFHEENGFLEVETPMLHPIPGGALAKPFITHHNALDIDLYLRVAPELYLKRLLVGGCERVFEIGKCFRNEGIDITHNPEFTMLESYAAYWDEEQMMDFVENLFVAVAKKLGKDEGIMWEGKKIIFKKPFSRISFKDLLARYAQVSDYHNEAQESLRMRARQLGIEIEPETEKAKIADEIFKKICGPYLSHPTFVIHHPIDISPLAKKRPENPEEVRRFQLVVASAEVVNGFSELNDPLDQRDRFESQNKVRESGDEEAHRVDEDYIEAMEYGMPPAAGIGIGIDRLTMLFSGTKNIKEVILFPTMKPRG